MSKIFTFSQHAPGVWAVHSPNGDIAALLDDREALEPRSDGLMAAHASVLTDALNKMHGLYVLA